MLINELISVELIDDVIVLMLASGDFIKRRALTKTVARKLRDELNRCLRQAEGAPVVTLRPGPLRPERH